jgi:hypothetical protein
MKFKLTSSAFKSGAAIPRKHSGEGDDVSPSLAWEGAPDGTKEYELICDDPDAPSPEPWVHWVIYGIPADARALPEGVKSNVPELKEPFAARQGRTPGHPARPSAIGARRRRPAMARITITSGCTLSTRTSTCHRVLPSSKSSTQ